MVERMGFEYGGRMCCWEWGEVRGELWVNWCGVRCRGRGKWKCGIRSVGGVYVVGEVGGV